MLPHTMQDFSGKLHEICDARAWVHGWVGRQYRMDLAGIPSLATTLKPPQSLASVHNPCLQNGSHSDHHHSPALLSSGGWGGGPGKNSLGVHWESSYSPCSVLLPKFVSYSFHSTLSQISFGSSQSSQQAAVSRPSQSSRPIFSQRPTSNNSPGNFVVKNRNQQ